MASSPEIGPPPPESKPMGSPPPSPSAPPPQENPQPTTADPADPAQSDHAKSPPPPHPGNATATSPGAYESPAPTAPVPTDGTSREAGRPPSLSASPALEATGPEGPTSPFPPPPVEACPEAATTEASPTPSPSTQIVAAPAANTPPPSTASSPPASPPGALPDASPTDSAATVSNDAAQVPAALESMDASRPTAPTPPQQHPRPPCPTMLPGCQNSLPTQPPSTRRPLADIAHALTGAIAVTSGEPGASSSCKSDAEESFELPMPIPLSFPTEVEPGSPEIAPPGFEKFKSSWPPMPSPNLLVKTTHSLLNAARPEEASSSPTVLEAMDTKINTAPGLPPPSSGSLQPPLLRPPEPITQAEPCSPDTLPPGFEDFKLSRLPPPIETTYTSSNLIATEAETVKHEEAVLPVPALEAIYVETDGARNLLPPLDSKVEGLVKQPLLRSASPVALSEPCSLEMTPPGFVNFGSSWQRLSTPLSVTAHIMPDATAMEPMAVKLEEAAGPSWQRLPTPLSVTAHVMPDAAAVESLVVKLEEAAVPSCQRLSAPLSVTAHIKPDAAAMEPLAVKLEEAVGPSWQRLSTPLSVTAHIMPDAAAMEPSAVKLEEAAGPRPAFEAMDMHAIHPVLVPLESGMEGSLQEPQRRPPSPTVQDVPCSPDTTPPGPQVNSVTTHAVDTQSDAPATVYMILKSDETALPPPALQAMDTNMDSATARLLPSGNGAEGSLPQPQHQPSSPSMQATPCSLDDLDVLPPPPPPFLNKEMGQMVCGSCHELLAYPRGAVHVQCAGCRTINLVLEAHEVGNVQCGRCKTFLMYPFGAPAVKCSWCLFVTEIGERNVRPRISVEQVASPRPPELVNQG